MTKQTYKHLWQENAYYDKTCTGAPLSDEAIRLAEKKLGYKLPQAYLDLMRAKNGGALNKHIWLGKPLYENEYYAIFTECFYSLDDKKQNAIFGEFGNQFWFDEWGYPKDLGVIIADTISGGHEMLYLDYRDCGKAGEPKVSICYQESDFKIIPLANTFDDFLSKLCSEDDYAAFIEKGGTNESS